MIIEEYAECSVPTEILTLLEDFHGAFGDAIVAGGAAAFHYGKPAAGEEAPKDYDIFVPYNGWRQPHFVKDFMAARGWVPRSPVTPSSDGSPKEIGFVAGYKRSSPAGLLQVDVIGVSMPLALPLPRTLFVAAVFDTFDLSLCQVAFAATEGSFYLSTEFKRSHAKGHIGVLVGTMPEQRLRNLADRTAKYRVKNPGYLVDILHTGPLYLGGRDAKP